jgi:MFS superfamily sulfate permease-like transporter
MGLLQAFFRVVVALFVVVAGLLAAAAMAVVAAFFFLLRQPRKSPGRVPTPPGRASPRPTSDVIDVTATEVSANPEKP